MAILRRDDWLQTPQGQALAGAKVFYLTQPADTTDFPPGPLASVFSDLEGTPAANPQLTDGFGHAVAYLSNAQLYTVAFFHPLLGAAPLVLADQSITGGSGSPAVTPFAFGTATDPPIGGVVNGTNTVFTLPIAPATLVIVQFNSAVLVEGVGYTTAIVDGVFTITLAIAPAIGDTVNVFGLI